MSAEEKMVTFARLAGLERGQKPYQHQLKALECLEKGQSILLHAPTGSGKSEAAFIPFLMNWDREDYPSRFIYALPMRALVDSLAKRFSDIAQRANERFRVAAQHGHRPESVLFWADAVIATIDQVISSYVCAPLSLGVRHGNIPAGAVASSFLVFDEIHTFDPERALQSCLLIADRLHLMGVPFVIMSATLPRSAREALCQRLGLIEIGVEEAQVPVRAKREVHLNLALDRILTPEVVRQTVADGADRVLVVCNTVDRAIGLYQALQDVKPPPVLVHSRFLEEDRKTRDFQVQRLLGKSNRTPAVVIATQVVEVGLDVSCDVLLTELCPIDALIQRAGRCARWAEGPGRIDVYALPSENGQSITAPYDSHIVQETARALEDAAEKVLTWKLEQDLIDKVLGNRYCRWLESTSAQKAAYKLANAAFTGDRRDAEEAVREEDSVEICLHTQPERLQGQLRFLPRISVSAGLVRRFVRERPGNLWSLEIDRSVTRDESHGVEFVERVRNPKEVRIGHLYILSGHVSYSAETGLVLDGPGVSWLPTVTKERAELPVGRPRLETMERHLSSALECFRRIVQVHEGYGLRRVASMVGLPVKEVEQLLAIALICHDLGKASQEWQRAAWETVDRWLKESPTNPERLSEKERELLNADRQKTLLARFPPLTDRSREPPRPAHATVSAYVMWDFLKSCWGNYGQAAALAMAHHHSVRASQVPKYRLQDSSLRLFSRLLKAEANVELEPSDLESRVQQRSTTELPLTMPPFRQEKPYTLYVVLSRCLSLSDRMAAGGGEDAILDYEKWAGNL